LYGDKGGYVVYCDGHVAWFDGSKPARFSKWDKSGYTSNILEAKPPGAIATCMYYVNCSMNALYIGDDVAILYSSGY
jgi:prepilin-type processing-associated H-X9-DG protein